MTMEKYEPLEIEVIEFDSEDVIDASDMYKSNIELPEKY